MYQRRKYILTPHVRPRRNWPQVLLQLRVQEVEEVPASARG